MANAHRIGRLVGLGALLVASSAAALPYPTLDQLVGRAIDGRIYAVLDSLGLLSGEVPPPAPPDTLVTPPPPPVEPPPPPPGGCRDPNNVAIFPGTGAWAGWLVRSTSKCTTVDGHMAMLSGSPGGGTKCFRCLDLHDRVVMTCEIKFPETWLTGINLGGQHLFSFGIQPRRDDPANGVRLDFGAPNDAGGSSFKDGLALILYEMKDGTNRETQVGGSLRQAGAFRAGVWTPLRVACAHDRPSGRFTVEVTYGSTKRTASFTGFPGNRHEIGESFVWGNVDGRGSGPGVEIRNLRFAAQ